MAELRQKSAPPSRAETALDTSPPQRGVEDRLPSASTRILHPGNRGGGAERSEAVGGHSRKPHKPLLRSLTRSDPRRHVVGLASVLPVIRASDQLTASQLPCPKPESPSPHTDAIP